MTPLTHSTASRRDVPFDTTYVITYTGKTCGEIKSGDTIGVAGNRQNDGSVLATAVADNK